MIKNYKILNQMNTLLNFIGYYAEIKDENTVCIYDDCGLYTTTSIKPFSVGIYIRFKDRTGNLIEYSNNCIKGFSQFSHSIRINSGTILTVTQENNIDGTLNQYKKLSIDLNFFGIKDCDKQNLTVTQNSFNVSTEGYSSNNAELIQGITDNFEQVFPGIKRFIENNFDVCSKSRQKEKE